MTKPPRKRTFAGDFRQFFGRGLAILLPSILTLWILWQASVFVFNSVAAPINRGIRSGIQVVVPLVFSENQRPGWYNVSEEEIAGRLERERVVTRSDADLARAKALTKTRIRKEKFEEFWEGHWYLEATGLVVAIVLIYLAGLLLGGLIGRKVYKRIEALISRIPGFKQVYPHVKQLVELVMGERPTAFKRVVLVEYPRKGLWTLGLVTGQSVRAAEQAGGGAMISIFIPSTPTPFTGFVINIRAEEAIDLPMTIDEAIRFVITGGVLVPDAQLPRMAPQPMATVQGSASGGVIGSDPGAKPAN